jgi:hypothetical protein
MPDACAALACPPDRSGKREVALGLVALWAGGTMLATASLLWRIVRLEMQAPAGRRVPGAYLPDKLGAD